jgi:hypothetical protein
MTRMDWSIDEEREVSPGNYAKLLTERCGWLIWSFETATGVYYSANKPAEALEHPAPLGVHQAFFGQTPYASIVLNGPRRYVVFHGRHHYATVQWREVGARFLNRVETGTVVDPDVVDGKRVEVLISSMPGERAVSKIVQDHGFIDMTGTIDAIGFVDALM